MQLEPGVDLNLGSEKVFSDLGLTSGSLLGSLICFAIKHWHGKSCKYNSETFGFNPYILTWVARKFSVT